MEAMEEYLRNLRSLRSQMNEIEEAAAKRSVEEQKQRTAMDAAEKDLQLVISETKRLNMEVEELAKVRANVRDRITEKQKKVSALETESSMLSQTSELLQQEMAGMSHKLKDKRSYYKSTLEDFSLKLQAQQDWFSSYKKNKITAESDTVTGSIGQLSCIEGNPGNATLSVEAIVEEMGEEVSQRYKYLMAQLESKEAKLEKLMAMKSEIAVESAELKQQLKQLANKIDGLPREVKAMDEDELEEVIINLTANNKAETSYLESLQDQIKQLKEFSNVIKCPCGMEYKVELNEHLDNS